MIYHFKYDKVTNNIFITKVFVGFRRMNVCFIRLKSG